MYIILKTNSHTQRFIEWLQKQGETIHVDRTTITTNVKTTKNVVGSIKFVDNFLKVWKAGEPENHILIYFKDLVSVTEL